jgi:hypothetical protein
MLFHVTSFDSNKPGGEPGCFSSRQLDFDNLKEFARAANAVLRMNQEREGPHGCRTVKIGFEYVSISYRGQSCDASGDVNTHVVASKDLLGPEWYLNAKIVVSCQFREAVEKDHVFFVFRKKLEDSLTDYQVILRRTGEQLKHQASALVKSTAWPSEEVVRVTVELAVPDDDCVKRASANFEEAEEQNRERVASLWATEQKQAPL